MHLAFDKSNLVKKEEEEDYEPPKARKGSRGEIFREGAMKRGASVKVVDIGMSR